MDFIGDKPARPAVLRSVWVLQDGLRMHARISWPPPDPEPTPVVLVHGLSVSSLYMVPTARHLAPHRQAFAPDLPGFGESQGPPEALDIPALADALLGWMDRFDLERPVLLGNSMGCQIIADLAARHPARLAAAVLVGPTMDPRAWGVLGQIGRLLRDARHESPASILTQTADYLRFGLRRTLRTLRYALADPFLEKLPRVSVPALVVRGERDPIAPQEWCAQVASALPAGRLVVLPGAPHALNYDRPADLTRTLLGFLAEEGIS